MASVPPVSRRLAGGLAIREGDVYHPALLWLAMA